MKKPFHEYCIEISDKATTGEWEYDEEGDYIWGPKKQMVAQIRGVGAGLPLAINGKLIAKSRTLLPECARRLARAIEAMKNAAFFIPNDRFKENLDLLAHELEAPMPEEKK